MSKKKEILTASNSRLLLIILIAAVLVCTGGLLLVYSGGSVSWNDLRYADLIGADEDAIEEECGDVQYMQIGQLNGSWQFYTDLAANTGSVAVMADTDTSFSMIGGNGGNVCQGVGGKASELFGLTGSMSIDRFMEQLGTEEENGLSYSFSYGYDIMDNAWKAVKAGVPEVEMDGQVYGYSIAVYPEGLAEARCDDVTAGIPPVDAEGLKDICKDTGRGYDMVTPDTRVVIMLTPR